MRVLLERRYWERVRDAHNRLGKGVESAWQTVPAMHGFIDYYPQAPGTLPEKKVFNALAEMQISFYFAPFFGDIPMTERVEHYRPDFILPDYHIIIEIQGFFWHSQEGSYLKDYQRALMLTAMGFKLYTIEEASINLNVYEALREIPEVASATIRGGQIYLEERPQDPTASLRAQRQQWPRQPAKISQKHRISTLRAFKASGARVGFPKSKSWYPMFTSEQMDPGLIAEYQKYGRQWVNYIHSLEDFFHTYPEARSSYAREYALMLKWRGWWGRFKN